MKLSQNFLNTFSPDGKKSMKARFETVSFPERTAFHRSLTLFVWLISFPETLSRLFQTCPRATDAEGKTDLTAPPAPKNKKRLYI